MTDIILQIGRHIVGDGQRCFVVAEVGSNHNQSLDLAIQHIEAAADAGVDAVKFQTFRAVAHYSRKAPSFSYLGNSDTFSLIESLELNWQWHKQLKDRADELGLEFFSTPSDIEAINHLADLGVYAYKVASFELPDTVLIGNVARQQQVVILSTGMATWSDIQNAVEACRTERNQKIILLQCTSLYPAPPELSNLASMSLMRRVFGLLTGYSDHTLGDHIAVAAVALGACVLEKHFTLSRTLPGPDHSFATEPSEMKALVAKIRDIELAIGDGIKNGPRPEELEMATKARRSLHAGRDIRIGEIINRDDIVIKRPGLGISPSLLPYVIGRTARVDIEHDLWITWNMLM